MRAFGIDPGTAITGWGVVEERQGELAMVAYGTVVTPAGQAMSDRLKTLHEELQQLLSLHAPDTAAVERLFFQKNVRTALTVGQARGVALLALAEQAVPMAEYTPLEVKLAVAGYGGADKRQVQEMVRTLLGLAEIPQPDDAADALAIAICHLHASQFQRLTEGR